MKKYLSILETVLFVYDVLGLKDQSVSSLVIVFVLALAVYLSRPVISRVMTKKKGNN